MVNCLVFAICYFRLSIRRGLKNFCSIEKRIMLVVVDKNVLKLWHYKIIWCLFAGFKTLVLCSVHSTWLIKYVISVKMWFMKTLARMGKYKPRIVKSNCEQGCLNDKYTIIHIIHHSTQHHMSKMAEM